MVTIIPFDTGGRKNNRYHTTIKTEEYKKYSRKGGEYTTEVADWIICVDIDEIIYHPNLHQVLRDYKKNGVTVPHITGFNMVGTNEIDPNQPILHQYDSGVREPVFDKRAIFDVNFDMAYSDGCHSRGSGFSYMKQRHGYKASNKHKIALLHYKHIGSRLLESSKRNLDRFSKDDINITSDGRYTGPGSHYKYYVDKAFAESPFLKQAKRIVDDNYNILFDEFAPTTGEIGENNSNSTLNCKLLNDSEVDILISCAEKLFALDKQDALNIFNILVRQNGMTPEIEEKISKLMS